MQEITVVELLKCSGVQFFRFQYFPILVSVLSFVNYVHDTVTVG